MQDSESGNFQGRAAVFKQRHLIRQHRYEVVQDGINVTENWLLGSKKYKVPFENVSKEPSEVTLSSRVRLWATIILLALSVITGIMQLLGDDVGDGACFFWGALAVVVGIGFLISRERFLVYQLRSGDKPLVLYRDKPSRELLERFMASVQDSKNEYLRNNYLRDDGAPVADAIHKLVWLHERGALTDEEFESLKAGAIEKERWGKVLPRSLN